MAKRAWWFAGLAGLGLVGACGDSGGRAGGDSASAGTTTSAGVTGETTASTATTSGGGSASEGTATASLTSTSSQTATDAGGSSTGGSSGGVMDTSSSSGGGPGGSSSGPDCMPVTEVCNHVDDDCDGIVDEVDAGGDGICDCLSIALFGNKGALPSSEFETWLEAQGTQVDRISLDATPVDQVTLDKYDIIILDWLVRTYSPQEAALIQGWVEAGGGLMSMTGHENTDTVVVRPNSIIQPMGLAYNSSAGFFDGPVTSWTPHPITMGITSVSFYGGLYVDVTNDGVGTNTVVGTLPPGPVAVAQVRAAGKLFVFGDEWIEFDSEWQNIPEIKQLWVNILGWLAPKNFCTIPQ